MVALCSPTIDLMMVKLKKGVVVPNGCTMLSYMEKDHNILKNNQS